MKFSDRYGYTKLSDVFVRECLPEDVENCIKTGFSIYIQRLDDSVVRALQQKVYIDFLHLYIGDFDSECTSYGYPDVVIDYLSDSTVVWYDKLNLLEYIIKCFNSINKVLCSGFVHYINTKFKELYYGYRIIDGLVVEVTSAEEIVEIEQALKITPQQTIKEHLSTALSLLAKKPGGDYRASIKESISAVEVMCRIVAGDKCKTLGTALDELTKRGILLHPIFKSSFDKLYAYTNQPDTGIRHGLMDDSEGYTPTEAEAHFMLVSCCAFVNYLNKKLV